MRVRSDLEGCVYVGSTPYFAGDTVPDGAVDPLFLEPLEAPEDGGDADVGEPVDDDANSEEDGATGGEAEAPASVSGDGEDTPGQEDEGLDSSTQEDTFEDPEVELGEFDPSTASVRTVREHLALNPGDKDRVLALEAAGKARASLIGE